MQELVTEAEILRQEEVKKSVLRNILWQKLMDWILENSWSHTQELPPLAAKKNEPSKQVKTSTSSWQPDPLWRAIDKKMPGIGELEIDANHHIESELVPKFMQGLPTDAVQLKEADQWNDAVQDHVNNVCYVLSARYITVWFMF